MFSVPLDLFPHPFLDRLTPGYQAFELGKVMQRFTDKASAYLAWMTQDLEILRTQTFHRQKAAEVGHAGKAAEVERPWHIGDNVRASRKTEISQEHVVVFVDEKIRASNVAVDSALLVKFRVLMRDRQQQHF